jgi:hypothetical protein
LVFDGCVDSSFIGTCHSAISVGHYENPINAKKVGSEDQGSQNVISYACSGIAQNFGITCLHPNNCKGANS